MARRVEEILEYLRRRAEEARREAEIWSALLKIVEEGAEKRARVKPSEEELPALLEGLRWRRYRSGEGEWVYADMIPEEVLEVLREKGRVEAGGYVYTYKKLDKAEVISRRRLEPAATGGAGATRPRRPPRL